MKVTVTIVPAGAHQHRSPAKAARELLESNPELQARPFGQTVSKIARGELAAATTDTVVPPQGGSPETTSTEAPAENPIGTVDVTV
jgi:hypothetical protein